MSADTLTELRQIANDQAAALDPYTQKLAAFRREMEPTVTSLRDEQAVLTAVDAETRAAWTALAAKYSPGAPEDPPALRTALDQRRSHIVGALRVFEQHPGKITRLLAQIESDEPAGLREYTLGAIVDEYRRQAATLLGSAAPLRKSFEYIATQTADIEALAERLLSTARAGGIITDRRGGGRGPMTGPMTSDTRPVQHVAARPNAFGDDE